MLQEGYQVGSGLLRVHVRVGVTGVVQPPLLLFNQPQELGLRWLWYVDVSIDMWGRALVCRRVPQRGHSIASLSFAVLVAKMA